jgi:hypothetical protein
MRYAKVSLLASILAAALSAPHALAQQQQSTSGPLKTAYCLIRIRSDCRVAPPDADAISNVANTKSVYDAALASVVGHAVSRSQYSYARFDCTAERRFEDAVEFEGKLLVYLGEADAAVDESRLLDAVIANLRTALVQPFDEERSRLAARRETAAKRLQELAAMRDALRGEQARLLQQAGAPLAPLELEKTLISLQDKRREQELTLTGQRARQDAISKAIAELTARIDERAAGDPVVAELQQVVEIRQRVLERMRARTNAGAGTVQEVDGAIESVAMSRAELAKSRAAAALNAGGDQIAKLNADLTQVSIDAAETRARAEVLVKQVEELRAGPAMKNAVEYDRLATRLRDIESALLGASEQVAQIEQQASQLAPPSLSVVH